MDKKAFIENETESYQSLPIIHQPQSSEQSSISLPYSMVVSRTESLSEQMGQRGKKRMHEKRNRKKDFDDDGNILGAQIKTLYTAALHEIAITY